MSSLFFDTHCHLNASVFQTHLDLELQRAQQVGVQRIMVPAVLRSDFSDLIQLAARYSLLDIALGLHPIAIHQHKEDDLQYLEDHLIQTRSKISAIGEIGLDNFMQDPDLDRQIYFLTQQLQLAIKYDLPIILHSRRTHALLFKILKKYPVPLHGVLHGFTGSFQQAEAFVKLGYFIGVGGTITYPRAQKTRAALARLPLNALVLETDAPDMPLKGRQGEVNRTEYIIEIFEALCELRSESPNEIMQQLFENSLILFQDTKKIN